MATTNKYLTHRGDIRAVVAWGKDVVFTTVHPDGLPTAIYKLNVEKLELEDIPLDCGGLSLAVDDGTLWLAGDNGHLYNLANKAKSPKQLPVALPAPATKVACLSNGRLAALCDGQLIIVDAKRGAQSDSFELSAKGTSLAADPTGDWLVVGTSKGDVSVFTCEEESVQAAETEKLHEGAVTALLFEPEELRFLSAAADQKLLLTHARGKLEPEDRGRGASHSDQVTQLLNVPGDRFISVSRDKSCKTWARGSATRPATFDDAVPQVVDATLVEIHERPHLVIAGQDNALRLILLDTGGRFSSMTHRLYDAYDRAAHLLQDADVGQRGEALHALASYDDAASIELLAKQAEVDADHGLRLRTAELIAKSNHPRAARLLEPLLKHRDEEVRLRALDGLRRAAGKDDLRPFELALAVSHVNIGLASVAALEALAGKDDHARQLLIRTLDKDPPDVRHAAVLSLEKVFAKESPESTLTAAKSAKADVRRLALIRSFQRKLLDNSRIEGMIRRSGEDKDADVRRTAFLVALLSRPKLAKAVRSRDKELHRQLFELENFQLEAKKGAKAKDPPAVKATKVALGADDLEPLLSAMASRAVDTCLLGSRCLALLGDSRAFGSLLQLSREKDPPARVQVCQALATLSDVRAAQRLETLLNDSAAEVQDAAYTALEGIYAATPFSAADVGLKSSAVAVRRRALKTLTAAMRQSKSKTDETTARGMMLRALNDDDESVRGEAFKTSLGMQIDGSPEATLQFALNSVHPSVRREVLTEAMAQDKQEWAKRMLANLLNDPSPTIRDDAFEHMLGKGKGRDIQPMQLALQSRHSDIRLRATQSLVKLNNKPAQESFVVAVDDDVEEIRMVAIKALVDVNAVDQLQVALSSKHTDVRLHAACARALFQDTQATAPLVETATATEPERDADKPLWEKHALTALAGLALLGLPDVVDALLPLLDSTNSGLRQAAATALVRCARAEHVDRLKEWMQHQDPSVSYRVALALSFCQEPTALPIVFSKAATKVLSDKDRLMALIASGEAMEMQLVASLDSQEPWIRNAAFLVLMFRDWRIHDGTPSRVLRALSTEDPGIRLAAARALEAFSSEPSFANLIVELINDRGDETAWTITLDQIQQICDLIVFSPPHCAAQVMIVLERLAAENQDPWDFAWHVHSTRNSLELVAASKAANRHKAVTRTSKSDELSRLAFWTYVGLVRQQDGYHERGARPFVGQRVTAIRQVAIRRLVAMAQSNEDVAITTRPVLIQALSDDLQDVRMTAFEQLAAVGVSDQARAAAAIECGHTDLAIQALKLLSDGGGAKGKKVLEDVVVTRDDDLAAEAAQLLLRMTDARTAAKAALQSPHHRTPLLAVGWLANAYDDDKKTQQALVDAYDNRLQAVQREVAIALATKKHKGALDLLIEQLPQALTKQIQRRIAASIEELGDPKSPDALLDALEADQEQSMDPVVVFTIG